MIDLDTTHLALRARMLTLSIATTGSMSLSATATGYARATGSFLADGFVEGMETTPLGFPSNPVEVVTAVSALALTTGAHNRAAAAGARSITAKLPLARAYENVSPTGSFVPEVGKPYVEENFVPATNTAITTPRSIAHLEETGIYVIKWFGLAGYGPHAIRKSVRALKALFAPGTSFSIGTDRVEVRGNPGPFEGQIIPVDGGWAYCTLTIPWLARSRNTIAA